MIETFHMLYDKTVQLHFKNTGQRYHVSFKEPGGWTKPRATTGVTTILRILDKPALLGWAASESAKCFAKLIHQSKELPTKEVLKEMIDEAKNAHNRKRDAGASTGSDVHEAIENFLKTGEIPVELTETASLNAFEAFLLWWRGSGYVLLQSETPVYSREFDYSGTFDATLKTSLEVYGSKLILCDFKTSNKSKWAPDGIYIENFAQMGGYARAYFEERGVLPDDLLCVNVGKDGEVRKAFASDFGMTVQDAIHYFECIFHCWHRHKHWDWKFKGN